MKQLQYCMEIYYKFHFRYGVIGPNEFQKKVIVYEYGNNVVSR